MSGSHAVEEDFRLAAQAPITRLLPTLLLAFCDGGSKQEEFQISNSLCWAPSDTYVRRTHLKSAEGAKPITHLNSPTEQKQQRYHPDHRNHKPKEGPWLLHHRLQLGE
jgi:hypothetical protein